jgi:hypothetical protein
MYVTRKYIYCVSIYLYNHLYVCAGASVIYICINPIYIYIYIYICTHKNTALQSQSPPHDRSPGNFCFLFFDFLLPHDRSPGREAICLSIYMHTHTHTHTHKCTHTHTYTHIHTHTRVSVYACVCVCMHIGNGPYWPDSLCS